MSRADEPATRADLDQVRGEMQSMGEGLRGEIGASEERLRGEVAASEERLRGEVAASEERLRGEVAAAERRVVLQIGDAISRSANVMMERFTDLFRAGDDRVAAVADRVTTLEHRVDDHVSDRSIHARRRARRK